MFISLYVRSVFLPINERLFATILNIPTPYNIDTTGGLIDVSRRVTIVNEKTITNIKSCCNIKDSNFACI